MKEILLKLEKILLTRDVWIYIVLILMANLIRTFELEQQGWGNHLYGVISSLVIFSPALVFVWYDKKLKRQMSWRGYWLLWLFCFLLYFFVFLFFHQLLIKPDYSVAVPMIEFYTLIGVAILFLSMVLKINRFLGSKLPKISWIKKMSLDRALLLLCGAWAFITSFLAAASGAQFEATGLIGGADMNPANVLYDMPTFFSFLAQFFVVSMAGYFFYYFNAHVLFPKLLKKRGLLIYLVGIAGTIVICYPILGQILLWLPISQDIVALIPSEDANIFNPVNGAVAFMITFLSIPIILVAEWFKQSQEITNLEKQKLDTELSLLKQQINPHFFFNTLNNLYSLSLLQSQQTPEVILQLSELMRYVIYRGREDWVLLQDDLKYIDDYIQLQALRMHKSLDLRIEKDIDWEGVRIPPLLFIILVENAFKHGIEPAEGSCFLHIRVVTNEKQIVFYCENSFEKGIGKPQGIGLENLQRRLDLRFPDRHEFFVEKGENRFKATLKLDLV